MAMRTTARFDIQRHSELMEIFTRDRMCRVWRTLVKSQLRRLDIPDLHDYYDFNFNIEARAEAIIERILAGQYRAESPLVYRVEKKLGICRHMMLPSPADALVFQVIADVLFEELEKVKPSKKAFYARDRHSMKLPHEVQCDSRYPWFVLWPQFQEAIWGFAESHPYLVTTDLANYYDNIAFDDLRRVIAGHVPTKEVVLDLLFSLIEDLAWRPDYLPKASKGLPTIEIEAPRLLANALLFELDAVLKDRTKDSFVRWMDDINFGVEDVKRATHILGELNDVLKSRGLALNLAKTQILNAKEVEHHFLFKENVRLTKIQERAKKLKSDKAKLRQGTRLVNELNDHLANCGSRNRDKVTKRYFTILTHLRHTGACGLCPDLFAREAGLRASITRYLSSLPYSRAATTAYLSILGKTQFIDDVSKIMVVRSISDWAVPRNAVGRRFVDRVLAALGVPVTAFDWHCQFLLLSKYGEPHKILSAFDGSKSSRKTESFLARQGIALLARSVGINEKKVRETWEREVSTGLSDSASVAVNLLNFHNDKFPAKSSRAYKYLFPKDLKSAYPISKFLLLCVVAASETRCESKSARPEVAQFVKDEWMVSQLKAINPIWFKQ